MKVKGFQKKYEDIRAKSQELHAQLAPLLNELGKLAKKAQKLEEQADNDPALYVKDASGNSHEDGWGIEVLFRLGEFDVSMLDAINIIDSALYNISKTPFVVTEVRK